MEAKELRIWNYVNHKELGYVQVYGMNLEVIQFDYRKEPYYDEIPFEKLSYVPLTEEILLKCGFEKYSEGNFVLGNFILSYLTTDENFEFEYKVSGIDSWLLKDIKYLHQLQNLYFALTNEELTVNL